MLKVTCLILMLLFGLPSVCNANDYVFGCKNEWMQAVDVKVTADSENAARKILKTQDPYRKDYSLCSFRREIIQKTSALQDVMPPTTQSFSE